MSLKGVLLDIDGTLVISNDAHAQAWVEAFADFGYKVEFDQVRPLIGMGGDQVVPKFAPGLSGEEGEGKKIADRRKELIINKFGKTLAPAPGTHDLIMKVQNQGLKTMIASSATTEELSVLLKAAGVDDLLSEDSATTSSDAKSSKPAPDIVEAALEKVGLEAPDVIMLGDTPYDIESAGKAGVKVIAFRCGGFDDSQLSKAIAIYDNPADLLAQYDNSPLAA
ncbi:phosphoglycolate phosphatase [Dulcicalothrix desertica PCC 7102]|uniref:Phosphoglycolate phosphatase n=1 Tax=Dulcicalothrix desertica PCC 7102 TaxID=232991 RepID=A0A3S1CE31_9CYAN|nr:HAD family hydrolase [Dulcicalothrix desertica]RUT01002.1 phosphoglycolate phosphatase [Dulcicalothrix desertica PCC 7102]TWH39223.1 HAD superfamily hydrolase (TIGR01509 family)/HAD superfamily hydrolase (TIGR01549 family) [Dulcicalothrix desertica PCC 7102]